MKEGEGIDEQHKQSTASPSLSSQIPDDKPSPVVSFGSKNV